jgi:hypothetical protein
MRLLLWLILALETSAAVLRVPADFAGVQAAMDASQAGDTVVVDRGVWTGLLESPAHTLLLCSNYPFTLDSTDIAETILDGEHVGTILTVHTGGEELLTVRGLTFWRGQGHRYSNLGYDISAGAVQMVSGVSAVIEDVVFADCRAPDKASILFHGQINGSFSSGSLVLRRIHCRGTQVETTVYPAQAFQILASGSHVIVDGFYWDGGNTECPLVRFAHSNMDTLALNNVRIVNCYGKAGIDWSGFTPTNNSSISNIYSEGCRLSLRENGTGTDGSTTVVRNLEFAGGDSTNLLYATPRRGPVLFDGLHVHHNRMETDEQPMITIQTEEDNGHVLRNLNFHDNTQGDSIRIGFNRPQPFIYLSHCDLIDARIHDNTVNISPDPTVGETPGNYQAYGGMLGVYYGNRRLENVHFENNRVNDLDVYTDVRPEVEPGENNGRELYCQGVDTLTLRNVTVRNSQLDNPVPELVAADDISYAGPGFTFWLDSDYLDARGILLENCDDGGIWFGGAGLIEGALLRNVKRTAFGVPSSGGTKTLRNVFVDTVIGGPNWLQPPDQFLSRQGFLWGWNFGNTTIELDNVTVVGTRDVRQLINLWTAATLIVRNSLFHDNEYEQFIQVNTPAPQTWDYNILPESMPGIGNQVGVDPWFDEELGAPWLSPISPAIDAGHPDLVYNDIEDPDNPGFALWPSQGNLRNDIGYTGGPAAGTLEHWVAVRKPASRPPANLPQGFILHPAHPNPFNPSTTVSYTLARLMQVELSVYNLLGQQVRTLAFGLQDAGEHSVPFMAGELASGVYVVELQAGGHSQTMKVLLLK